MLVVAFVAVASFTDAWIETFAHQIIYQSENVASFTDAWIETNGCCNVGNFKKSHLLQMRGLKHLIIRQYPKNWTSHLLQMRGLKQQHG